MSSRSLTRTVLYRLVALLALSGAILWVFHLLRSTVDPDPDSIVLAMFEDDTSDAIIYAIERLGNPSAFSEKHGISLITASIASGRWTVREWLINHGAEINPRRGPSPLYMAALGNNSREVRILLDAGCSWDGEAADGMTVRQYCERHWLDGLAIHPIGR